MSKNLNYLAEEAAKLSRKSFAEIFSFADAMALNTEEYQIFFRVLAVHHLREIINFWLEVEGSEKAGTLEEFVQTCIAQKRLFEDKYINKTIN